MAELFNLPKALADGYSYTDVAEALAKQNKFNLAKARADGYDDRTIAATLALGRPITGGDAFFQNLEQQFVADYAGIAQLAKPVSESLKSVGIDTAASETTGIVPEGYEDPLSWMAGTPVSPEAEATTEKNRLRNELEARITAEVKPGAALAGRFTGALTSPINLLPIGSTATAGKTIASFGAAGAVGGAIDPIFEELGDKPYTTRAQNIALGGAFGGTVGALWAGSKAIANKIFTNKGGELADVTDDVAAGTADLTKPHYKYKGVDEEGQPIFEQVGTRAVTPAPVKNAEDDLLEETQNIFDVTTLPKLPQYLSGAAPRFGKSEVEFETDLDRALYIVGRSDSKSAKHQDYVNYLTKSLNLPEADVLKLAKEVRTEQIGKLKTAQMDLAVKNKPQDRIKLSLSEKVENLINPVDKYLDDSSKMMYNYGKTIPLNDAGKMVISPKIMQTEGFQRISTIVKQYVPEATDTRALMMVKGYQDMLDKLKEIDGRGFKARSFEDMLKNKEANRDMELKLRAAGELDGC
jgi:hypothetical protein